MKSRGWLLLACLFLLPHCSAADSEPASEGTDEQDLSKEPSLTFGTWKSPICETVDDKTFQLRTYKIAANGTFADWTRYSSPNCSPDSVLLTIRTAGSSKTDRLSRAVSHAFDIRVFIAERAIVPLSKSGVDRLTRECAGPAWTTGVEIDIGKNGCGTMVPANATCPVEYDLMKLSGGKLFFGVRTATLCTEATRPKKLSPWGVALTRVF